MLSDRERETLDDMERALLVEDPKLVRRIEKRLRTLEQVTPMRYDWVLALALGLLLLFSALAVLLWGIGEALALATLACSLALVRHWLRLSMRVTGQTPSGKTSSR